MIKEIRKKIKRTGRGEKRMKEGSVIENESEINKEIVIVKEGIVNETVIVTQVTWSVS